MLFRAIIFTIMLLVITQPAVHAQKQRYEGINTIVSESLKRQFLGEYGYPWEEASEEIQRKYFYEYNVSVRKDKRLEARLKLQKERKELKERQLWERKKLIRERERLEKERQDMIEARQKEEESQQLRNDLNDAMREMAEKRRQAQRR